MNITYEQVRQSEEIRTYITQADQSLVARGFTEHSFAHVTRCAEYAARILDKLGYGEHDQELARIAGFMHDIGNVVNRHDHAQTGAVMAFRILDKMGMEPADVAAVITAIGHHDDPTAFPVNPTAAALILADKTDVRRSRVRNKEHQSFDIHDRVNYAAERSDLTLDPEQRTITLSLSINTESAPSGLLRDLPGADAPLPQGRRVPGPHLQAGHQRAGPAVEAGFPPISPRLNQRYVYISPGCCYGWGRKEVSPWIRRKSAPLSPSAGNRPALPRPPWENSWASQTGPSPNGSGAKACPTPPSCCPCAGCCTSPSTSF